MRASKPPDSKRENDRFALAQSRGERTKEEACFALESRLMAGKMTGASLWGSICPVSLVRGKKRC